MSAVLLVAFASVQGGEQPPVPEEQAPATTAPGEEGVDTVWKRREVSFTYRSSVALFHCGALEARVRTMLIAMGARQDVSVRASNCSDTMFIDQSRQQGRTTIDPYDPLGNSRGTDAFGNPRSQSPIDRYTNLSNPDREQVAHVSIKAFWPTVMTPEIIGEMRRDQSRRELISRVTKDPAAREDLPVVFRTTPQQVTLSNKTIGIEPVECELVDQFSRSVFKELGVRIVSRSISCDRRSVSRIPPQLTVETLMPVAYAAKLPEIEDKEVEEDETAAPAEEKPEQ